MMTFSQVGKCLMLLEVLRVLEYDEQCNFINNSVMDVSTTSSQCNSTYQRKF